MGSCVDGEEQILMGEDVTVERPCVRVLNAPGKDSSVEECAELADKWVPEVGLRGPGFDEAEVGIYDVVIEPVGELKALDVIANEIGPVKGTNHCIVLQLEGVVDQLHH